MTHITNDLKLAIPVRYVEEERVDPKNKKRKIIDLVPVLWAYHTPITKEVFEQNYLILTDTKDALFSKGSRYAGDNGPRIARLVLRDVAEAQGKEDSAEAVFGEIRRLTMILLPDGKKGFKQTPVEIAIQRKAIDPEEWEEVESALVFFTCAYMSANITGRRKVAELLASALRGSITSLSLTEFAASLRTSTQIETTEPGAEIPS